jgi:glycosyltransferase involved in cell wall biosynthesis
VATALERSRRGLYFRGAAYRRGRKDYLFVSGPGGDARRYRCDHQAEALRIAGATADVGYHDELDLESLVGRYRTIVLYRVPWDAKVAAALQAARMRGTRVLADIDDLVFDPAKIGLIHGVVAEGPEAVRGAERRAEALAQTLTSVDGVTVSTEPLRAATLALNPSVTLVHNSVSAKMVELAERTQRSAKAQDVTVVAYLSGTATHDRDFLEAADAVLAALDSDRAVRFCAVGFLNLDDRFEQYGERVVRVPYQPWRRLPGILANVDISLAPLEVGNEFTNAKSCLKYLEASLVGVPTIASPTADFRRVIDSEANGLLARTSNEWREAIAQLVASPERSTKLGSTSRSDVLAAHTTAARALDTHRTFEAAATPALGSSNAPGLASSR